MPQSIYEDWVVVTRPTAVNGFGMLVADADQQIQELLQHFMLLRDERGIYSRWYDLVVTHNVQGKQAHDTRLVAAMERHGLKHLLTFNKSDFARFSAIVALSPDEVVTGISQKFWDKMLSEGLPYTSVGHTRWVTGQALIEHLSRNAERKSNDSNQHPER